MFVVKRTFLAAALVCLALSAKSAPAYAAGEGAELEKARAAYTSRNYEDVERRLRELLESARLKDPVLLNLCRMYYGGALVQLGRREDAVKVFEAILDADGQYEPDPLTFSSQVMEVFIDTRAQLRERIAERARQEAKKAAERKAKEEQDRIRAASYLKAVETLAAEESVVVKHSRALAFLPFGVGQFQNGQKAAGWAFLLFEAAFIGGSLITVPFYVSANDSKNEEAARDAVAAEGYRQRAIDIRTLNLAFNSAFLLTWIGGVIQAHATFVPESKEIRPRPLPKIANAPRRGSASPVFVEPSLKAEPGGASIGLRGQF
ncbi:MAG: hypothetical protein U0174_27765 [Polyangiaceae bacterium]